MNQPTESQTPPPSGSQPSNPQTIVVQTEGRRKRSWFTRILFAALVMSILFNMALLSSYEDYLSNVTPPIERFHSGDRESESKIAVIDVNGTIMPPFTGRILKTIKHVKKDSSVKGVVLSIDSPGGLVADSHQIYHRLIELNKEKPVFVVMKRMAASGGVYVAMGAGPEAKIFAEPTTWTGSIGVIIPRYQMTELASKIGIDSKPLKTGPFKDALSPFRELTEDERVVWDNILDSSFQRFINVIADNRKNLDYEAVKKLATGQIYTADDAKANGLIDEIGYEDDAIDSLKEKLGISQARVVSYKFQPGLMEILTGTMTARQPENTWRQILESTVPRAMYFCSWAPSLPTL